MAYIKFILTAIIFYLLQKSDFIWYALLAPLVQLVTTLCLAWLLARRLTRDVVCKKILPRVNPKRKAVLITGCDSGFGQGVALQLNKDGFFVFAGCLNANLNYESDLKKKAHHPSRLVCLQMNVTKDDEIAAAYEKVRQVISDAGSNVDKLFALINNAGIAEPCLLEAGGQASQDSYVKHLQVNTLGVIRVTKAFLPLLREAKQSRVVNISSMAARSNLPTVNPYAMSKAATSKFTEGLQEELAQFGVRTFGVEPWFHKTQLADSCHLSRVLRNTFNQSSESIKSVYQEKVKDYELFIDNMLNNSLFTSDDTQVAIDAIVDSVTSAEPDAVSRIVSPFKGFFIWLYNDMLPWEVNSLLRIGFYAFLKLSPSKKKACLRNDSLMDEQPIKSS